MIRLISGIIAIFFVIVFSYHLIGNSHNILFWLLIIFSLLIIFGCLIPDRYPNIQNLISNILEVVWFFVK